MIKRLVYIGMLLIAAPGLSMAKSVRPVPHPGINDTLTFSPVSFTADVADTTRNKKQEADDKKKIKEIAKARRQAKPEKLVVVQQPGDTTNKAKVKLLRQRRPDGLERPPEIPRRNN